MKLFAIDGNSVLNRAFYGVKPLSNREGIFTNAVFGFMNIFLKAADELKPDLLAVAFDVKAPTFRHKAVESYKANRHGMPDELAMQLPFVKEILTDMGIAVLEAEGWEADDILGTLAGVCDEQRTECVLLTGDRDILQLLSPSVEVRLETARGLVRYTPEVFREEYGFEPVNLADCKGLMGDSSDNIPGVAGIGEKTAMKLIAAYATIENLYDHLPEAELSPSLRKKLEAGKEDALRSKWLATIARDAPVSRNLGDYKQRPRDSEALSKVLTRLELYKLLSRLNLEPYAAPPPDDAPREENLPPHEIAQLSEDAFERMLAGNEPVDFLLRDGVLLTASGSQAARVEDSARILRFLTSEVPKRTFDSKPVYRCCMAQNETLRALDSDAMISAYLLNPSAPEYTVERLCAEEGIAFRADMGEYAGIDALGALSQRLERKVREQGMEKLLREVELPLVEVLADMEHTGVKVDADGVRAFGEKIKDEQSEIEARIYELAGHEFNILSTKQLGTVLFEELRLPCGKKTKTGWSTNAEVLEGLRHRHPIVDEVLRYRQLSKLSSTYVDGLLKAVAEDGRIHTRYRQTETRTGRISSTEPNLQNIPVRTPLGREMRKFFVAREGCVLVDADYSQIELRIVAHLCGDENMRMTFEQNRDIHTMTAAKVFNMPEDMVTKEMRTAAKAVNFGILYGIGPYSLSKDLNIPIAKAERYIRDYLNGFPRVEQFMNETVEKAKKTGYVTTFLGRKRYIPELGAPSKLVQAAGRRVAMNTPVQGAAADIIKTAMVRVYRRLAREVPNAKLILQIHDELIVETPSEDAQKVREILSAEMTGAARLSVPLVADVRQGASWYDAKG